MSDVVDVAGLVADDLLDLEHAFRDADWFRVRDIGRYTLCVYGARGDEPGEVTVTLESAQSYGIVGFRWRELDAGGSYDFGPVTLDSATADLAGADRIADRDDPPNVAEIIKKIVATGYFGVATEEEIKSMCYASMDHSQGYLLLPSGGFPGEPLGRLWTTGGYLQCEHVALKANSPTVRYAAAGLLRAVETAIENRAQGD